MPKLTFLFLLFSVATCLAQSEPPTDWNDPDTGHRKIQLSREAGSASLYFHQNAYSPDGKKLIITTPTGLSTINLQTRAIEKDCGRQSECHCHGTQKRRGVLHQKRHYFCRIWTRKRRARLRNCRRVVQSFSQCRRNAVARQPDRSQHAKCLQRAVAKRTPGRQIVDLCRAKEVRLMLG